jgi:hypothetical protein
LCGSVYFDRHSFTNNSSSVGVRVPEIRTVSVADIVCIIAYFLGVCIHFNISSNPIAWSVDDGIID